MGQCVEVGVVGVEVVEVLQEVVEALVTVGVEEAAVVHQEEEAASVQEGEVVLGIRILQGQEGGMVNG